MTNTYEFTVTLRGEGANRDEAWGNAVDAFCCEPGETPPLEEDDWLYGTFGGIDIFHIYRNDDPQQRARQYLYWFDDGGCDGTLYFDITDFDAYREVPEGVPDDVAAAFQIAAETGELARKKQELFEKE